MKLEADTARADAPGPSESPEGALLQFDFDAVPELPRKRSTRLEWKSPEKAGSIKEAIARWLDEQL